MKKFSEILDYKNDKVVHRFLNMYNVDKKEAEDIFKETIKYLYLNALTENKRKEAEHLPSLSITFQMQVIDEMWHAFILNTRDYEDFCNTYLSQFVHHPPASYGRYSGDYDKDKEKDAFSNMLHYIYNELGEETVEKWFATYADKYSLEKLAKLRKS